VVKIRLMRMGKKKQPTYRVVVADARSPRDGRFVEIIGKYGPREEPPLVDINNERALEWLSKGAQPTEQVGASGLVGVIVGQRVRERAVRRIERGDLLSQAFGEKTDVLMVDQSDSMTNSSLQTLLSAGPKNTATTKVFLCLPSCIGKFSFSGIHASIIELAPLSLSDARNYLQERATSMGRPNLFTAEASDMIIDGSRGLPRALPFLHGGRCRIDQLPANRN